MSTKIEVAKLIALISERMISESVTASEVCDQIRDAGIGGVAFDIVRSGLRHTEMQA